MFKLWRSPPPVQEVNTPKKHSSTFKYLTHNEKIEVAKYLAEFRTPKQASFFIRERFGKEMTEFCIKKYFLGQGRKWEAVVRQFQLEYVSAAMNEPIAQKRVRLARYEELYQKAMDEKKYTQARSCLDSAREEVEGNRIFHPQNLIFAQINSLSDEDLMKEYKNIMERLKTFKRPEIDVKDAQDAVQEKEKEKIMPIE